MPAAQTQAQELAQSLRPIPYDRRYDHNIRTDPSAILRLQENFMEQSGRMYIFRTEDYIPTRLPASSNDGRLIAGRVVRHSLQTWVDNENRNNSALKQSARQVDNAASQEVNFSTAPNHKVDFRIKAFQDLAALRYHGPVKASFYYYMSEQAATVEITQEMWGKTFFLTHIENYLGSTDTAGVRWTF